MLSPESWLPKAQELALGQRQRTDHDCGGGRTLSLEHTPEGYRAWCYRCSDSGWHPHPQPSLAERIARLNAERAADSAAEAQVAPPVPSSFDPREWPLKARVWLYTAGFTNDEILRHGFYYSERLNRVVLPVLQRGDVVYWQARGFDPKRPKYLNPPVTRPLYWAGTGKPIVLTEDILSSARVGEVATGCGVLGTSLRDDQVTAIAAASGGSVLIWLDPDPAGRRGANKLARDLALAGTTSALVRSPRDPKLHTPEEIREFIQSAWKSLSCAS